jgi:hypothetical protein
MVTQVDEQFGFHIALLRLVLLDADHIGGMCLQPFEKAFLYGSPEAVHVVADDFHGAKNNVLEAESGDE